MLSTSLLLISVLFFFCVNDWAVVPKILLERYIYISTSKIQDGTQYGSTMLALKPYKSCVLSKSGQIPYCGSAFACLFLHYVEFL